MTNQNCNDNIHHRFDDIFGGNNDDPDDGISPEVAKAASNRRESHTEYIEIFEPETGTTYREPITVWDDTGEPMHESSQPSDDLYTIGQIAEFLDITIRETEQLIDRGELKTASPPYQIRPNSWVSGDEAKRYKASINTNS